MIDVQGVGIGKSYIAFGQGTDQEMVLFPLH